MTQMLLKGIIENYKVVNLVDYRLELNIIKGLLQEMRQNLHTGRCTEDTLITMRKISK